MPRVLVPVDLSGIARPRHDQRSVAAMAGATMGTTWSARVVTGPLLDVGVLHAAVEAELDIVIAQMSTWTPDSDLSRFNRAPAGSWRTLPPECFAVLDAALRLAEATAGAYDPTIGRLVDLWGFGPAVPCGVPPARAIEASLAGAGWARVTLDRTARGARQPGGLSLDLSSIAKGFAVDQVARALERAGVESYLVEIGGELRGRGAKPDGSPWWVAVEQPLGALDRGDVGPVLPDTVVALHGLAVATSGDYRRFFERDGTRYSHTIDPRTGRPVDHALASVTVLHPECMMADAFATALTVLGGEAGLEWARRRGVAALFVERGPRGLEERSTPALAAMLE